MGKPRKLGASVVAVALLLGSSGGDFLLAAVPSRSEKIVDSKGESYSVTYDSEGSRHIRKGARLIAVESPDGTVIAFAYDESGKRVQTRITRPGGAPQFIDEAPTASTTPTWNNGTRVAQASSSAGTTETSAAPELDPQPYGFAGERRDEASGLNDHRARWMDPRTGRFLSPDPYRGEPMNPLSLHPYGYAHGDPANRIDPTGMYADLPSTTTTLGKQQTLHAMSVPRYTIMQRTVATTLAVAGIATSAGRGIAPPKDPTERPRDPRGYWVLFRNMTETNPIENFMSNMALDLKRRLPQEESDFIYDGISTWDSLARARAAADRIERSGKRQVLGIAELNIPYSATDVFIVATFRGPGHYTIRGAPEVIWKYFRRELPRR